MKLKRYGEKCEYSYIGAAAAAAAAKKYSYICAAAAAAAAKKYSYIYQVHHKIPTAHQHCGTDYSLTQRSRQSSATREVSSNGARSCH